MKDFQIVIRPSLLCFKQPLPAAARLGFGSLRVESALHLDLGDQR